MKKTPCLLFLFLVFFQSAKTQTSGPDFDTLHFSQKLELANWLTEYEYHSQLSISKLIQQPEYKDLEWLSYLENQTWHTVGGNFSENEFRIVKHVVVDSLYAISDFYGTSDTSVLKASGIALSKANTQFQLIRDTCNLYFNSFVSCNPDQTISIWYLPAFQPSGQAIYGCEWQYIYDKTGNKLLRQNSNSNIITSVWVGQPRELWLNYRNMDVPTVGSIFFVLSFRDYFTRIRIDTRISTSTHAKDSNGNYAWTHKLK